MVSLSSARSGSVSRTSVTGSLQVRPPSPERLARTARFGPLPSKLRPIGHAGPPGPKLTHRPLARGQSPPPHRLKRALLRVHGLRPPNDTPLTTPLAHPRDH